MATDITLKDIGPVEEFAYTMDAPGLYVLRGKQQAGKTTILRTVQLALDGRTDVKPTKRDGTKTGVAKVGGKTLKISRAVREEGELSVDGLGDLDIGVLHSPKFKDAVTRDKYRIGTLVRLAGAEADASLFRSVCDDFDEVVDSDSVETDDLVEMASKVKRALDKAALAEEKLAEDARANERAQQTLCEGVDITAPHDESELQESLSAAISELSRLQQQKQDADEVKERAAQAKKELDAVEKGQSVEDCQKLVSEATETRDNWAETVKDLETKLQNARNELDRANDAVGSAEGQLEAAERQESLLSKWREDIAAAESVVSPIGSDIEMAEAAVDAAKLAVSDGANVRKAISAAEEAKAFAETANSHEGTAEKYREAAQKTFGVLSEAIGRIPDCPLKVHIDDDGNTRLVIETSRSKTEPFDELSDGERWKVLLPLCFKKNRLLVLPQSAFGEISPANKKLIHNLCVQHECMVLTAQVDDGDLRCEKLNGEVSDAA